MANCVCTKDAEISEIHTIVKSLNKAIMGNGQPGILQEHHQFKGAIKTFKWLIGVTGLISIVSFVKAFIFN